MTLPTTHCTGHLLVQGGRPSGTNALQPNPLVSCLPSTPVPPRWPSIGVSREMALSSQHSILENELPSLVEGEPPGKLVKELSLIVAPHGVVEVYADSGDPQEFAALW